MGNFLLSLAKAQNFEMTMMFVEDKEKSLIKEIIGKLPSEFSNKVQKLYNN